MERTPVPEPDPKRLKVDSGCAERGESPKVPACEAVTIHIVDGKQSAAHAGSGGDSFNPEFTHQVFGDDEVITGYEGLAVDVFVDGKTFYSWGKLRYESCEEGADDVVAKLSQALEDGFLLSREEFDRKVDDYAGEWFEVNDLGKVISRHAWKKGELIITYTDMHKAVDKLKELHSRLELFLTFFIDGFSSIDPSDPNWEIYVASYKIGSSLRVIGFAVVYNLRIVEIRRKRVGQFFILPNHQGSGAGTRMMEAIYKVAVEEDCLDVTLEDPSENMQNLRMKLDTRRLFGCDWLRCHAAKVLSENKEDSKGCKENQSKQSKSGDSDGFHNLALDISFQKKIRSALKIPHAQLMTVWEALLLVEAKGDPEKVKLVEDLVFCRMANHCLKIPSNKVILETVTKKGPNDCFMMLKCRNIPPVHEALKKGIVLTPPEESRFQEKVEQVKKEVDLCISGLKQVAIKHLLGHV